MEENDKGGLLGKVRQVGERLMEVGGEVSRLGNEASHAVEDGVAAARRFARRGRTATEDLIDDAAYHIRHEPLRSRCGFSDRVRFGRVGYMAGDPSSQRVGRKSSPHRLFL